MSIWIPPSSSTGSPATAPKDLLVAPLWSADKRKVLNTIHHEMKVRDSGRGKQFSPDNGFALRHTKNSESKECDIVSDSLTLYKLIILFMLDKVDFPLTTSQISEFILEKEYTSYFYDPAGAQ